MRHTRRDLLKSGASLAGAGLLLGGGTGGVQAATYTIDSDLTASAGVTGEELDAAMQEVSPGSPLVGLGDTFVAVEESQGINAIYMAAHAAWESAWGRSNIAQTKNNLYGWRAYDSCPTSCSAGFESFAACVRYVMPKIRDLYLVSGGTYYTSDGPTLRGMNRNYATDPNWAEGIAGVMNSIADNLDTTQPPSLSVGQDVVTTGDVNVRNGAGTSYDVIDTRADGDTGTVVDGSQSADGYVWWKIEYSDGTTGWSVQRYLDENTRDGTRFAVDERIETTAELSVRAGPGTNYDRKEVTGVGDAGYV
ncbi:MAG: glucosaminidase domain-containing protein, partial [Halobaculum sp.]